MRLLPLISLLLLAPLTQAQSLYDPAVGPSGRPSVNNPMEARGGEVTWARLQTEYIHWNRHSNAEPSIVKFIHDHTRLNIGSDWQAANIDSLDSMIQYPFLYSEGIQMVTKEHQLNNLREYLLRGGFIVMDACINTNVTPNPDLFVSDQIATIKNLLPGSMVRRLPEDDPIFNIFFKIEGDAPHSFMDSVFDPQWAKHGFYAIYYEDRPVALVSVSGLKCGWADLMTWEGHDVLCSQMMVNIYIWAMTR